MNVSRLGVAERERADQQRQIDHRVGERDHLEAAEGDRTLNCSADSSAAEQAQRRVGLRAASGRRLAGHQANSSCSESGVTAAPVASHAMPTSSTTPLGEPDQRLDASGARPRPTTPRRARGSSCRPGSRRPRPTRRRPAPSARPMTPASRRAARPASGRRRPAPGTATDRLWAASSGSSRSAQRTGCSSSASRSASASKPASRAASPSWLGEPRRRSSSSITSAASVALGAGSNGLAAARRPAPATDPTGRGRGCRLRPARLHRTGVGCAPWLRRLLALGLGLRGRAALAGRASRRAPRSWPSTSASARSSPSSRCRSSRCRCRRRG